MRDYWDIKLERFMEDFARAQLNLYISGFSPMGDSPRDPVYKQLRLVGLAGGLVRYDRSLTHGHSCKHPRREGATST